MPINVNARSVSYVRTAAALSCTRQAGAEAARLQDALTTDADGPFLSLVHRVSLSLSLSLYCARAAGFLLARGRRRENETSDV